MGDLIQLANPSVLLNWLNRKKMAKIISDKYVEKDDPIFSGRYTVNNPNVVKKRVFEDSKQTLSERRQPIGGKKKGET